MTILAPQSGSTVRFSEPLVVLGTTPTLGGTTLTGVQVQVSTGAGGTGTLWDTGLRAPDGHAYGGNASEGYLVVEIDLAALRTSAGLEIQPATTYYLRMRHATSAPLTSAWSADVTVTTEARRSAADWLVTR